MSKRKSENIEGNTKNNEINEPSPKRKKISENDSTSLREKEVLEEQDKVFIETGRIFFIYLKAIKAIVLLFLENLLLLFHNVLFTFLILRLYYN